MSMSSTCTEASNEMGAFCRKASAAVSLSLLHGKELITAWHGQNRDACVDLQCTGSRKDRLEHSDSGNVISLLRQKSAQEHL